MRAADLDDGFKVLRFLRQRSAQHGYRRQQFFSHCQHRRHMHGGGKNIVGRLTSVHVIVGVDPPAITPFTAQQFTGPVGQHLIDVHIGLRPRAGLPDHQRKLTGVLARNHLIRGSNDSPSFGGILQTQCVIHTCRAALDLRQCADDLTRLLLAGNSEVLQRALGLRSPQPVSGHFNGPKSVSFSARGHAMGLVSTELVQYPFYSAKSRVLSTRQKRKKGRTATLLSWGDLANLADQGQPTAWRFTVSVSTNHAVVHRHPSKGLAIGTHAAQAWKGDVGGGHHVATLGCVGIGGFALHSG